MRIHFPRPILCTLLCLIPAFSAALSPITQYYDLVAGLGDAGYRDGPFALTLFDRPAGLAITPDGKILYVADLGNHRIRKVDLERRNEVSTLAGTGEKGGADGSLARASFDQPQHIVLLKGDRLAIWESGSGHLRLLDMRKNRVSTVSLERELKDVYAMAAAPGGEDLLMTIPTEHLFLRVDPRTGKAVILLKDHPQLPTPGAFTQKDGVLWFSDRYRTHFARCEWDGNTTVTKVEEAGKGARVMTMTDAGRVYAFQCEGPPWLRVTPKIEVVRMQSLWGRELSENDENALTFLTLGLSPVLPCAVGVPDDERRIYLTIPHLNVIVSLRDYDFVEDREPHDINKVPNFPDLNDYSYPEKKPPHTFRILMLGDSRIFYEAMVNMMKRWPYGFNIQDNLPKKLEAYLNIQGGLQDQPVRFQVLTTGYFRWQAPLFQWPMLWGVKPVYQFDVDLILMMMPADINMAQYTIFPMLPDGNLNNTISSMEWRLKPIEERMAENPDLEIIYQAARKMTSDFERDWIDENFSRLVVDPNVRPSFLHLIKPPIRKYRALLAEAAPAGKKPPPLVYCFLPLGNLERASPIELHRAFWTDVCRDESIPLIDLSEPFSALRVTAHPVAENAAFMHPDFNGHTVLSWMLTHELVRGGYIPWKK